LSTPCFGGEIWIPEPNFPNAAAASNARLHCQNSPFFLNCTTTFAHRGNSLNFFRLNFAESFQRLQPPGFGFPGGGAWSSVTAAKKFQSTPID